MVTVHLEQLERCIRVAFAANVPVAIWSRPGYAKSSIARQVAAGLRWPLYDVRLSLLEPSDLAGVPYPTGATCSIPPPDWLPFAALVGEQACVLFLDEFDHAEPAMQNTALQLLLDRCSASCPCSAGCQPVRFLFPALLRVLCDLCVKTSFLLRDPLRSSRLCVFVFSANLSALCVSASMLFLCLAGWQPALQRTHQIRPDAPVVAEVGRGE